MLAIADCGTRIAEMLNCFHFLLLQLPFFLF